MTASELAVRLHAKPQGRGWEATCPAHEDKKRSLSIGTGKDDRVLLKCHRGCSFKAIVAAAHLEIADLCPPKNNPAKEKKTIVATYPYHDEHGTHLFDVVRFEPKTFRPRRLDGTYTMDGVRRVLFGLPELRDQSLVFAVEGEKDVLELRGIGLVATTSPGGAGQWREEYTQQLKSAGVECVLILPDNDDPGRAYADAVAQTCRASGLSVTTITLPDLPPGGDVSDYLNTHSKAEFDAIVAAALEAPETSPVEIQDLELAAHVQEPAPVDLAVLLDDVERFIRRYVVLTPDQLVIVALWVAHTWAIKASDTTPYLHIGSATKRSGKTRLLEVLNYLVQQAWLTGRTTAAALVRKIDGSAPTLLLDETDAAFRGPEEYGEALRAILNSGYKRNGVASLCVGKSTDLKVKDFKTFCPKVLAGIGRLPDTVSDRSIPILLKRRATNESIERWRDRDGRAQARPLADRLARWAPSAREPLKASRPTLPDALSDRAQDVCEPLLAIADAAGSTWPARARRAVIALMGVVEDADPAIELLTDLRKMIKDKDAKTIIPTKDLIDQLVAREDRPWSEWRRDKPITPHALAGLLKPLGIYPGSSGRARGYSPDRFADAFLRYLPCEVSKSKSVNESGPEPADTCDSAAPPENTKCQPVSAMNTGLGDALTLRTPDHKEVEDDDDADYLLGL
jgi:hypothetical protein